MIKNILLSMLLTVSLFAESTTTETIIDQNIVDKGTDKYGNQIYQRDVTIKTSNYKVDNFWKKFSFDGKGQDSTDFQTIAKTGTVQMSVEATSLCSLYPELDDKGCSGQKPFLINDNTVASVPYDTNLSLIFKRTENVGDYKENSSNEFYPLDIERTEKYYKSDKHGDHTSFFGFFFKLFTSFFGQGTSTTSSAPTEDIRQRYMANVVAGVDQDHLLTKNKTTIKKALNKPVSFIDYSETVTTPASCRLGFFRFSAGSIFCNFPFFSKSIPQTTIKKDTILADTESALISFAGSYVGDKINDYNTKSTEVKIVESDNDGFFGKLKCFLFGCPKRTITAIKGNNYSFPADSGITMTMAVTNGGTKPKIDSFEHFRLLGIRSVYGDAAQCKIGKKDCLFFIFCKKSTFTVTPTSPVTEENEKLSPQDWLSWCDRYKNDTSYHSLEDFFGKIFSFFKKTTYRWESGSRETESSLILDLKRIKLDRNTPGTKVRYKLMNTK